MIYFLHSVFPGNSERNDLLEHRNRADRHRSLFLTHSTKRVKTRTYVAIAGARTKLIQKQLLKN